MQPATRSLFEFGLATAGACALTFASKMTTIPDQRHSPEELPGNRRARFAVAPNAGFAQPVGRADLHLSVGDWLITLIVLAVPILNVILYLYWAFFSKGNKGRINFCRASLILILVGLFLVFVLSAF